MKTSQAMASAPGRMDVMGGIADYSGSLVLQMPIKQQTQVRITLTNSNSMVLSSSSNDADFSNIEVNKAVVYSPTPADLQAQLAAMPGADWAAYVLGGFMLLHQLGHLPKQPGALIEIEGQVPVGKGVSSSAALEVATLRALEQLTPWQPKGTELPRLAQQVENQVVGAPCGLMDQLASHCGVANHLLPIVCQPDLLLDPVPLPAGVQFVGIDSMVAHSVGGASYGDVRTGAFMGMAWVAKQLGATAQQLNQAAQQANLTELPYAGYLANITPSQWLTSFENNIPPEIKGSQFNQTVGGYPDAATAIQANAIYYPRVCARHPVMENHRVHLFHSLLLGFSQARAHQALLLMGELMYQSHQSYSACGLGHPDTDLLVQMARAAGPNAGVFGAKITGGGSGGTVCMLVQGEQGHQAALDIKNRYAKLKGKEPTFF